MKKGILEEPQGILWALFKSLLWLILAWQSSSGVSDTAIRKLLIMVNAFHGTLAVLIPLQDAFPTSVARARSLLGIKANFTKCVVCSQCHCLYRLEECYETHGRRRSPRKCPFIEFPLHPQPHAAQEALFRKATEVSIPVQWEGVVYTQETVLHIEV